MQRFISESIERDRTQVNIRSSEIKWEYENEGNRGGGEGLGGLGQKQVGQTLKNVARWKFSLVLK